VLVTRSLLVLLFVAAFVLAVYGMARGWRARARRQAAVFPSFPTPPADLPDDEGTQLLAPLTGVYVGTTTAGNWQDRIVVGDVGHRAEAELRLFPSGLLVDRVGASPLWIPAGALRDARTDRALAGKVMTRDGLLVVTWSLGEHLLDTGFRADEKTSYAEWVRVLRTLVPEHPAGEAQ